MKTSVIKVYSHEELSEDVKGLKEIKTLTLVGGMEKVLNLIENWCRNSAHEFLQFYTLHGITYYVFRVWTVEADENGNVISVQP